MTLTTPRLLIRPVTEADAAAMFAACSDTKLTEHTTFDTHTDRSVAVDFIAGVLAAPPERPPDPLAMTLRESPGHLIGCIGARWADEVDGVLEFGYWLARSHWGRGLTTEAVGVFVPALFAAFPVGRLQTRVFEGNPASGRVLEKCGFTHEGTLRRAERVKGQRRDVRMYSRLRDDPVPDPAARPPTLRTLRLVLRPIVASDAAAIFAACSDSAVTAYLLFPTHASLADTHRFLADVVAPSYAAGSPGPWAVSRIEAPDRLVGCVGARPDPAAPHRMEVGYWLARDHWGRGLAAEAVAAVAAYVFGNYPVVERLFGRVFDGNPGSRRVLEKAGFVYEGMLRKAELVKGRLRDDHYYSRLRDDPPPG